MKNVIRSLFLVILVFSTNICFAGEKEEADELEKNLLIPIVTHFAGSKGSVTDQVSSIIMDKQKLEKRQFTREDIQKLQAAGVFGELTDSECSKGIRDSRNVINIKNFVEAYKMSWGNKDARCGRLAVFTLMAFEFNVLSNPEIKANFRSIRIVAAMARTGDHATILVEGKSGITFVVDPWIKSIAKLPPTFPLLSSLTSFNTMFMREEYIKPINLLFSIPYYDVVHVNYDTIWRVEDEESDEILDMIRRRNLDIQQLYDYLRPSFRQWKTYDQILPAVPVKGGDQKTSST
jgi:hypothetical protein